MKLGESENYENWRLANFRIVERDGVRYLEAPYACPLCTRTRRRYHHNCELLPETVIALLAHGLIKRAPEPERRWVVTLLGEVAGSLSTLG